MLGLGPFGDNWAAELVVVLGTCLLMVIGFALVWLGNIGIKHRLRRDNPNKPPHYNDFLLGRYVRRHGFDDNAVTYLSGWGCVIGGVVGLSNEGRIAEVLSKLLAG